MFFFGLEFHQSFSILIFTVNMVGFVTGLICSFSRICIKKVNHIIISHTTIMVTSLHNPKQNLKN